jgi:hypothetical protein
MKAQISFVEYLTSMIIFIGFVTFISIQVSSFIPNYLNEVRKEKMRSEAFQLSELLINDPGEPINWENINFDNVKRLGLSDETKNKTNFLSESKIVAFNLNCSNYEKIKEKLGTDYDFSVYLFDSKGQTKIKCLPNTIAFRGINITISRMVAFGNDFGELVLEVW